MMNSKLLSLASGLSLVVLVVFTAGMTAYTWYVQTKLASLEQEMDALKKESSETLAAKVKSLEARTRLLQSSADGNVVTMDGDLEVRGTVSVRRNGHVCVIAANEIVIQTDDGRDRAEYGLKDWQLRERGGALFGMSFDEPEVIMNIRDSAGTFHRPIRQRIRP
jgi:hypothetical protein